ncbi:hypothetical protein [Pseudomonas paeninsulae]|uniref:hypothetical protein n=1 Tax=Pseudomonas paeninsulae TaxID=3110772 RepID=UPI002D7995ED|nr:hypothetical protein [Pseudomonas sp. IT1137]
MAKSKVTEETRLQAAQMRSEGRNYKDIATDLATQGVTVDWCKRNLSTIAIYDTLYFLMEEITPLAIRPEGIARLQFYKLIKNAYGIVPGEQIPEAIERKVRRSLPVEAFIRPDWMDPQSAVATQRAILEGTMILMDRLTELTTEVCAQCPGASPWHVQDYMLKQLTGDYPGGPLVQGQHMSQAVERMVERMPQTAGYERSPLPEDPEFDELCV